MDLISIDIDNRTTGAIIQQIIEYIGPKCSRSPDVLNLSVVNKYFSKTIRRMCHLKKLCNRWVCRTHYANYINLQKTHVAIERARFEVHRNNGRLWIHFDSNELALWAKPFVSEHFTISGKCCGGRGWRI